MKGMVLARKLWPTLMARRIGNGSPGAIEQYQESIKDSPIKAPLLRGLADAIKAKTNEQLPILIEDDYVDGTASRLLVDKGLSLLSGLVDGSAIPSLSERSASIAEQLKAANDEKNKAAKLINDMGYLRIPYDPDKRKIHYEIFNSAQQKIYDLSADPDYKSELELVNNAKKLAGQKAIDGFMALSHITEQQANEWASKQLVQGGTNTNFKKPELLQALADAYRLSQGRIGAVQIEKKTSNRAHTNTTGSSRPINPGKNFNRKVLFHEFGHHLEATKATRIPGREYVKGKSDDGIVHRLSSLSPGRGYGADELAYKGEFIDEYVGKVYDKGNGELYSMGFEFLSDPVLFMAAYEKDPEHMAFIAGFLASEPSPAEIIMNDFKDGATDKKANVIADFDGAMKKLAGYAGQSSPHAVDNLPVSRLGDVKNCVSFDIGGNKLILFTYHGLTKSNRRSDKIYNFVLDGWGLPKSLYTSKEKEALSFVGLVRAGFEQNDNNSSIGDIVLDLSLAFNYQQSEKAKQKVIDIASKL